MVVALILALILVVLFIFILTKKIFALNKKLYKEDKSGENIWYSNGELHRLYPPAQENPLPSEVTGYTTDGKGV